MGKLMAGAAIANIDWPLDQYPAQSQFVFCEDKYDDCNLRAIAIEDGESKLLLLVYELSDIPEVPDLEAKVAEAVGYDKDDVIIAVTHNHTSPCDRGCRWAEPDVKEDFQKKYMEIELNASIKAAKEAVGSLRPAKYGYGEINSYINANELTRNPQIGYLCDENTNGYSDKTLAIMKFVDAENDKLICVLMNYCCHCGCAMGLDTNGKNATSGNFSGLACRFVEEYFGDGMVAAWTSGAAGNQHPLMDGVWIKSYTDGYMTRKDLPDGSGFMQMEQVGRQHGVDAVNGINLITEYTDDVEIHHVKKSVMLKNQINTHEWGMVKSNEEDFGDGLRSNQPVPWSFEAPPMIPDPDHQTELKFELVNFGGMVWVGMGAEPFCQIGRDIKEALPVHTMVITHTPGWCGDNPTAVGYIVDKSSIGSTNGKLFRNLIPGGYDDLIVDTVREMYAGTLEKEE